MQYFKVIRAEAANGKLMMTEVQTLLHIDASAQLEDRSHTRKLTGSFSDPGDRSELDHRRLYNAREENIPDGRVPGAFGPAGR